MSGLPYSNARQEIQNNALSSMMNSYTPSSNGSSTAASIGSTLLGGITSGISGIAGGLISGGFNLLGQRNQRKWEEEMWNKENEYNLPENQIQRLLDAGINPAAATESVLGGNGSTSASAPSNPGNNVMPDLSTVMANSANSYMDRELIRSQIEKNAADAEYVRSQNVDQTIQNEYAARRYQAALDKEVADGRISRSNADILEASEYWKKEGAYLEYRQQMQTLANSEQQFKNMEQDMYKSMAEIMLVLQQAGKTSAEIDKIYSDIGVNNAQIREIGKRCDNLDADTAIKWMEYNTEDIERQLSQIQLDYANSAKQVFDDIGINLNDSLWQNAMRLCSTGQVDEARTLLENNWVVLQYSDPNSRYADSKNKIDRLNAALEVLKIVNKIR